jgi:hypothetical protein
LPTLYLEPSLRVHSSFMKNTHRPLLKGHYKKAETEVFSYVGIGR